MRKRGLWFIVLVLSFMFVLGPGTAYAQGPDPKSGDRVVFGSSTTIRTGETVTGNVVVFGGSLIIENGAVVQGDTVVFGGSAEIAGKVVGDLVMMGGSSHLTSTGEVQGDLFTLGGSVQRDDGSRLGGSVQALPRDLQRVLPNAPSAPKSPIAPVIPATPIVPRFTPRAQTTNPVLGFLFWIFRTIVTALAMVALGILAMLLFPVHTNRITETARGEPIPSIGFGLLTAIAGPMLAALLVLTCIGIPVALVLGIGLGVAGLWGFLSMGILLGERLYKSINPEPRSHLAPAVVGILLLAVLNSIPVLNFLIGTVVVLWGMGAVVLTRFGTQAYPPATSATRPLTPPPAAQSPVV